MRIGGADLTCEAAAGVIGPRDLSARNVYDKRRRCEVDPIHFF